MPDNPAAWLNTTARFLAIDRIRRRDTQRGKYQLVGRVAARRAASTTSTRWSTVPSPTTCSG